MAEKLIGACVYGQSGGPSAVINASAYGVFSEAFKHEEITAVYAAQHGISGLLEDRLFDISREAPDELELLRYTPDSEFGSCRHKLRPFETDDSEFKRILNTFRRHNIRYFFYNGGNDSMDTCNKVSKYMLANGYECRIIGVPKTIDNDLMGTDHCPGYGSAAKYIATSMMEIRKDTSIYERKQVTIVEIMGRNAGWLTAASAIAADADCGPDLIYLPECTFDPEKFLADIQKVLQVRNNVLIAVSEGIRYADGTFVSAAKQEKGDGFGHVQLGGLAYRLAEMVKTELKVNVRPVEFSILQRSAAHCASLQDINEAQLVGSYAVQAAIAGVTDRMVGLERGCSETGEYLAVPSLQNIDVSANYEKPFPMEWINEERNNILPAYLDYALPLIQGLPPLPYEKSMPRYARLKKCLVK